MVDKYNNAPDWPKQIGSDEVCVPRHAMEI